MTTCTAQPVSWLELELHALGELAAARAAHVEAHLGDCPVCRGCLERIGGDRRELPRLVVPARAERRPWWNRARQAWSLAGAVAVAAAVILLVFLRRGDEQPALAGLPGPRADIKGSGEVAIELVRDRAGVLTHGPIGFRDGDRFQVLVTCGFAGTVRPELVIIDGGEALTPQPATELECGNRVVVPGAFRLTGTDPVDVCVKFAAETTACIHLDPE